MTVTRKIPLYDFAALKFEEIKNAGFLKREFYIEFPVLPEFHEEKTLFEVSGALKISVINRSYADDLPDMELLRREGCFCFNEKCENILQVRAVMRTADNSLAEEFLLDLPLSAPFVNGKQLGLWFDGTWLRFMCDGEVLNENSGLDMFADAAGNIFIDEAIFGVRAAGAYGIKRSWREVKEQGTPDFYSPSGYNAHAGDVMNYYHDGVYHLLYLADRRHHASRNDRGAHYIAHLTSKNLIDWKEQVPVVELDAPWKTCGTGTLVFHNGKYYMSYGWHSDRYKHSRDSVIVHEASDNGRKFSAVPFDRILSEGKYPMGATYAESTDGINFTDSNMLYHSSQNPSIYADKDGRLELWAGYGSDGIWTSDGFGRPFTRSDKDFSVLCNSVMRNTTECPSVFEWNGYNYIIIGFTGYYRTLSAGDTAYTDVAAEGENIYDGLCVPMVTEFAGNRRIMAGWLDGTGWGSVIVHRELVQEQGGKLGMKWLKELTPQVREVVEVSSDELKNGINTEPKKSFYFETEIEPCTASRAGLVFESPEGAACALQLDLERNEVQVNDCRAGELASRLPTALEIMREADASVKTYHKIGSSNLPCWSRNFCLPDIDGINGKFTLKVLCRYSKKLRSTVIDAEIAGRRTIISVRPGFFPEKLQFVSDGGIQILSAAMGKIDECQ